MKNQLINLSLDELKFFDNSHELFCVLNEHGEFLKINQNAWLRTLGYKEEDLIGSYIYDIIQKEDRKKAKINAGKLIRVNSSKQLESRFLGKNKTVIWLSLVMNWSESSRLLFLTGRDITESINERDKIIRLSNALLSLSKDTELFSGNTENVFKKITELSAHTLDVERVSIWFYDDSRTKITAFDHFNKSDGSHEIGQVLTSEEYPNYFKAIDEERVINADDARKDYRTSDFRDNYLIPLDIYSMLDAPIFFKGELIGVICHENTRYPRIWSQQEMSYASSLADFISISIFSSDLLSAAESLKTKNEELVKINEELDHFVYSTSHQLRSPISSILGLVNLLEMNDPTDDQITYMDQIKKCVSRLDETISEINSYYKNIRTDFHSEIFDVEQLSEEVWNDLAYHKSWNDIKFMTEIELLKPISTDRYRLYVILSNLLSNAIKYSDPGKDCCEIKLTASTKKDKTVINIFDNGVGIPPDIQNSIFEIFFRGTTISDGSGLGLYIVNEILSKLDGTISVKSNTGEFTEFEIII